MIEEEWLENLTFSKLGNVSPNSDHMDDYGSCGPSGDDDVSAQPQFPRNQHFRGNAGKDRPSRIIRERSCKAMYTNQLAKASPEKGWIAQP